MATTIVDRHQSPQVWMTGGTSTATTTGRSRFQYGPPAGGYDASAIPPKNERELSRENLIGVLDYFSQLLPQHFGGRAIRLVVHGGACMLLHPGLNALSQQQQQMSPGLPRRTSTRDVDYIHRSFITEMAGYGVPDAAAKLSKCVLDTAKAYGLGADWMNSDADIALPMAHDPSGQVYDPIYLASLHPDNVKLHTVYQSSNRMLTLISVTPFWSVALKLVRYSRWDPNDICLLLRNGTVLSGVKWTPDELESWITQSCWPMGYTYWDAAKKQQMRDRILDALNQLKKWNDAVGGSDSDREHRRARGKDKERGSKKDRDRPGHGSWGGGKAISAHDAMGGAEVVGGDAQSATTNGWTSSFGAWPGPPPQGQPQDEPQQQPPIRSPPPPYGTQPQLAMSMATMTMAPTPKPMNVRDWASDASPSGSGSGSGSDPEHARRSREKSRKVSMAPEGGKNLSTVFIPPFEDLTNPRSPSRSRTRSKSKAGVGPEDFFVPPGIEEYQDYGVAGGAPGGGGVYEEVYAYDQRDRSSYRDPAPVMKPTLQTQIQPQSQGQQPQAQWMHLTPNNASVSRPVSRNPSPNPYNGIYAPSAATNNPRAPSRQQPYGLDAMDYSLAAPLHPPAYESHGHRRHQPQQHQPVIPSLNSAKEKSRKKKEKQRKQEIERARLSKWAPKAAALLNMGRRRGGGGEHDGSDMDTDTDEDSETDDEDDTIGGRDGRRVTQVTAPRGTGDVLAAGRPWHSVYVNAEQGAGTSQRGQQQHSQPPSSWIPSRDEQGSDHERGRSTSQYLLSPSRPTSRNPPSRNSHSRNPSPNPTPKRRPAPLDLTPPPGPPPSLPVSTQHPQYYQQQQQPPRQAQEHPIDRGELDITSLAPAELAQYQFEQQQQQYQMQMQLRQAQQAQQQQQQQQEKRQPVRAENTWGQPTREQRQGYQHPQQHLNYHHQQYQQQPQQHSQQQSHRLRASRTEVYH